MKQKIMYTSKEDAKNALTKSIAIVLAEHTCGVISKEEYDQAIKYYKDEFVKLNKQPTKYLNCVAVLDEFFLLKDNWDGYGAIPPLTSIIDSTKNLLSMLSDKHLALLYVEDIYPNPHGTISIHFEDTNKNELNIEIGSESISMYGNLRELEVREYDILIQDMKKRVIVALDKLAESVNK